VGSFGNLLVASPTVPVHNLKELIDYAKRRPGQLSYDVAADALSEQCAEHQLLAVRTLTLNVKIKFISNDKVSENAPDFRIQATGGYDIGAAWKKVSQSERPYLSVTLDDPTFPATIYARLIEDDDGAHQLIWSRSKQAA